MRVVNDMFKANNLPTLKVPVVPQSDQLISKLTEAMESSTRKSTQPQQAQEMDIQVNQTPQTQEEQSTTTATAETAPTTTATTTTATDKTTATSTTATTSVVAAEVEKHTPETSRCRRRHGKRRSLTKITGRDIDLKIYTPRSRGWPETPLRKNSLH